MLSFKGVINCGLAEDGGWVLADRQPRWKEQDIQRRKRNLARDRERDIKVTEKKNQGWKRSLIQTAGVLDVPRSWDLYRVTEV
jgi:hypothetical protein